MPPNYFICSLQNEMVVLADGRVTTCCQDPLGLNAYGSVLEHGWAELERRHHELRRAVTETPSSLPKCGRCFDSLRSEGFPKRESYRLMHDPEERDAFLEASRPLDQLCIEPSSLCNLKCVGCNQVKYGIAENRGHAFLDVDRLFAFLDGNLGDIKLLRLFNWGETFMHPRAAEVCAFLKAQNPGMRLLVSSNGQLLNSREKRTAVVASGLDELVFSIHGGSQKSVQGYMTEAFDFEAMMDILRDMVAIKRETGSTTPKLIWKYLLFTWNDADKETSRAKRLAREIGLDDIIFTLPGHPEASQRYRQAKGMDDGNIILD